MNEIGFPGLGIDAFEVDRVAFTLFGRDVMWYGVIIAIGMLVAVGYVMWRTKEYKGIKPDDIIDYALFLIVFGVIGARLYYVIFAGLEDGFSDYIVTGYGFWENVVKSLYNIVAIWNGGLAIYGGIIAGAITAIVVCLIKKVRIPCFFDMLAPAVMIAQAIGRWGNFINAEAYGSVTALPWRMCSSKFAHALNRVGLIDAVQYSQMLSGELGVHPTFLYESLWNVLGFILLNILYKRRKFDGQIVLGYIAWYGLGRGFIEGLRTDSLSVGPLRVSQLVGFISCAVALGTMLYFWFVKKAPRYASARYKLDATEENVENTLKDIENVLTGAIEALEVSEELPGENDKTDILDSIKGEDENGNNN